MQSFIILSTFVAWAYLSFIQTFKRVELIH